MTDLACELKEVSGFSLDMFKYQAETLSYSVQLIPDETGLLLECNWSVVLFTVIAGVTRSQRPLLTGSSRLTREGRLQALL